MTEAPADWTRTTLGALGVMLKGKGIKRSDVRASGVPCIRYGELYTEFQNYTATSRSFVDGDVALTAQRIRKGDLLFAGSGETREEIGMCVAYVGEDPAVAGGDIIILRGDSYNPIYLGSLANAGAIAAQKARAGQGDAVVHLYARGLSDVEVLLPPRPEQDAIAAAILDADDQIAALERMIAKKQAIRKGMMQQLLTGKTRLPGFAGEWQPARLGDVLTVRHGKSQRGVEVPSGPYPILATGGQIGWAHTPLYSKPSVLIGRKGTIDRPQYQDRPFWTVDTLFYTEVSPSVDPRFLYYVFLMVDWGTMNEASGVPSLSSARVEGVDVRLPRFAEQVAIRRALDDADHEISALQSRLAKARAVKTGMMQELLTGRTRLPAEEGAE